MEGEEIAAYMDSVTPENLAAALQVIENTIQQRSGRKGLKYPELAERMYDTILLP